MRSRNRQWVLVVGYDGTEPAVHALVAAAKMLEDVPGRLEIVFVTHVPATVMISAGGIAAVREGFDREELDLRKQAAEIVEPFDVKWHFQRRNGEVAHELVMAGKEQLDSEDLNTEVVLFVGGSAHRIDRYLNSTPARVIRQDQFEVVVVP